eukprot:3901633-Amphidinium_carterae.1
MHMQSKTVNIQCASQRTRDNQTILGERCVQRCFVEVLLPQGTGLEDVVSGVIESTRELENKVEPISAEPWQSHVSRTHNTAAAPTTQIDFAVFRWPYLEK